MKKRHTIIAMLIFLVGVGIAWAGNFPGGQIARLSSLWVQAGDAVYSTTTDVVVGDNDAYIAGTLEVDGATRLDGAVTMTSTLSVTGGITDVTGGVTAGEIADVTREIYFPMAGWAVDSGNDIDDGSAPDLTTADNIPAIVWANSGETGGIQQTFRLPATYVSGLTLYCLISSDTASPASLGLDWMIWDNANGVGFDSAAVAQDVVYATGSTLDASCEVLTLTLDATGAAAMTAGHFYTIELFNATTDASANLELKGVTGTFTATQ